jgi:hypothetical protein
LPSALGVGDELAVDDVGQASFQASQYLHRCLARGELAAVLGAAFGVMSDLHDRGDVQDVVHSPVPGTRQDAQGRRNLPPLVGFSSNGRKGTVANAEATREFTWNLATRPLAEQMNATSTTEDIDEFEAAALEAGASLEVKAPRVAAAPVTRSARRARSGLRASRRAALCRPRRAGSRAPISAWVGERDVGGFGDGAGCGRAELRPPS